MPPEHDPFWIERRDKVAFSIRDHSTGPRDHSTGPLDVHIRYHVLTPTRISGSILCRFSKGRDPCGLSFSEPWDPWRGSFSKAFPPSRDPALCTDPAPTGGVHGLSRG